MPDRSDTARIATSGGAPHGGGRHRVGEVFVTFLALGLTSFGGPLAHIGFMREALVARRRWLDERAFADLVAFCHFLPGPSSSELGMAVGLLRAGYAGMLAAWLGFTLPSALAMALAAGGAALIGAPVLHGLKLAAVAVVAQAVLGMWRAHAADAQRASMAILAAVLALAVPSAMGQLVALVLAAVAGVLLLRPEGTEPQEEGAFAFAAPARRHGVAIGALVMFVALLIGLPMLAEASGTRALALFDSFYRAGALVFGGGHVVLPLLQAELVPSGFIDNNLFLAGYGAAQAVPGPLFTFAAYLGAVIGLPAGLAAAASLAVLCLVAIFLPGALLVIGMLPYWMRISHLARPRAALAGVNAAVVGLLLAALYDPVWTSAVQNRGDVAIVLVCCLLLGAWRAPAWLIVLVGALAGLMLHAVA